LLHRLLPLRFRFAVAALFLFLLPANAWAAVEVAFYSRELGGNNFPHAFVTLKGTIDATGEAVDTSYGFTAKTVTPAILLGSVAGEVLVEGERQIARSDRQFAVTLTDERYAAVMAVVERWRTRRQPSYNLSRRNCIHFVAEIAEAAGLTIAYPRSLMRRPRSYLQHIRTLNPQLAPLPAEAPAAPG
jgi:hypothetical protein